MNWMSFSVQSVVKVYVYIYIYIYIYIQSFEPEMLKRGCLLLFNSKYEEKPEENKEPK